MKKKFIYIIFALWLLLFNIDVYAKRGCCSHHGGVAGCSYSGRQICADGTYSPTCTCTPNYIYGCTDKNAKNYNSQANKNDGSCVYEIKGCTSRDAINYNMNANTDDGSCKFKKTIVEKEDIPYETVYKEDSSIKYGVEQVEQAGVKGIKEVYYFVIYDSDGVELSRTKEKETIIQYATEEIILVNNSIDAYKGEEDNGFLASAIMLYVIFAIFMLIKGISSVESTIILKEICKSQGFAKYMLYAMYVVIFIFPIVDIIFVLNKIAKRD